MRLLIVLILVGVVTAHEVCKAPHNCQVESKHSTEASAMVVTLSRPDTLNSTFTYTVNFTFTVDPSEKELMTNLGIVHTLRNITYDICGNRMCWVHLVIDSTYDVDFDFGGSYDYTDQVLAITLGAVALYPVHTDPTTYTLGLILCIVDPLHPAHNFCLQKAGANAKNTFLLKPEKP